MDQLRNEDVLVVWKLDRLSRSLRDVLTIMDPWSTLTQDSQLDRGYRHHDCSRTNDDADARGFC